MGRRVTILDVAKHAGVSHTTVSWAIHKDPRISMETRHKVQQSIDALGYYPHEIARRLVSGRTHTIALVSRSFSSSFEGEIIRGVEAVFDAWNSGHDDLDDDRSLIVDPAEAVKYSIMQVNARGELGNLDTLFRSLLHEQRADAVISLSAYDDTSIVEKFAEHGKPLVFIETSSTAASTVCCDSRLGAQLAVKHLLGCGYRKIGHVGVNTREQIANWSGKERYQGFVEEHRRQAVALGDNHLVEIAHFKFEEGEKALVAALDRGMDALFCAAGDMVALGVLDSARRRGVRIPEDLGIIGFDDILPSRLVTPALTTVVNPIATMAVRALRICMHQLGKGFAEAQHVVFPPKLIERGSTSPRAR